MIHLGETNFRESDWFDVDDIHGLRIVAGVTVKIPADARGLEESEDPDWSAFFLEHTLRPAFQQVCHGRLVGRSGLWCESISCVGVCVRDLVFGNGKNSPNRRKRLPHVVNRLVVLKGHQKGLLHAVLETVPGSCSKA